MVLGAYQTGYRGIAVIDEKDLIFNEEDRPMHLGRPSVAGSLAPAAPEETVPKDMPEDSGKARE